MSDEPMVDRRARLVLIRDTLTEHLADAATPYVAGIAKQLAAVLAEIDALPNADAEVSPLDELRAARAARKSDAADSDAAGRRNQQRRRGRVATS
jgi:hypothetical protein